MKPRELEALKLSLERPNNLVPLNVYKVLRCAIHKYRKLQRKNTRREYSERSRLVFSINRARPDASESDIQRAVEDSRSGSAFAQEMLNSRIGAQRRVLQEVQDRHEELRKMEASIEELATLFLDLQVLLEVFSF